MDALEYADETLQRVTEEIAFTCVDFVLCDRRYASHFAVVARERWNEGMLPVADWLKLPERPATDRIPFLWAVDADDRLHRVIVDTRLMQAARRCLLLWHRLQEHAGIHDSHADMLLAREKAAWDAERQEAQKAMQSSAAPNRPSLGRRPRPSRLRQRRSPSRRREAAVRRSVDRDRALSELQRMPDHQRQDVHLQR